MTPENRAHELRGLVEASKLPGAPPKKARELFILTLDQEDTLTENDLTIRIVPAWKWLD